MSCPPTNEDMWILLLFCVRYSMGRRTYASSLAPDLVMRYRAYLTKRQLEQIADEIEAELRLAERMGGTLGARSDHESWTKAVERIWGAAKEARCND